MSDHSLQQSSQQSRQCVTVYFDGACPICQREIAYYKDRVNAEHVSFVDASCENERLGDDLDRDTALARMHVRRADGVLVSGAAAFAELWQVVPGFQRLGRLASFKPVTAILELGYRATLKIRPRVQRLFR
jgi:predicted DCC family thiol-disulfide oxidoreductase YuxK